MVGVFRAALASHRRTAISSRWTEKQRSVFRRDSPFSFFFFFFWLFVCLFVFKATPVAYGSSQARGRIRAVGPGLHHSHSNVGSELRLRPTPQFTGTPILNPLSKARD